MISVFLCLVIYLIWNRNSEANNSPEDINDGKKRKLLFRLVLLILGLLFIVALVLLRPTITGAGLSEDPEEGFIDFNDVSSGRLHIWTYLYGELNLFGHDIVYFSDLLPEGYEYAGAHNTALDFAYRCGTPCGIAFLLFEILSMVYAFFRVKKASSDRHDQCFTVMVIVTFFIESMFEIQVLPTNRNITMLFFIASMLILSKLHSTDEVPEGEASQLQADIE